MSDVLVHCAKYGYYEKVKEVVSFGADVNKKSGEERGTPLYFASCYGHLEICKLLLENGADVNAPVRWGATPLHAVCDRGHGHVLKLLLENKPDLNYQNKNGDTCLHVAAYRGYLELSRNLVEAGIEIRLRNRKGKTAQDEAEARGHTQVARYLAEAALKAPIPRRTKSDPKLLNTARRLQSYPHCDSSRHDGLFHSSPAMSSSTSDFSDYSSPTTDWTTDSNHSLSSFPETFNSDSFIPSLSTYRSYPIAKPRVHPVRNTTPLYGYQSAIEEGCDENAVSNGIDLGATVLRLQNELAEERKKNSKLQRDSDMIPQLRSMLAKLTQDNWALRKDVEHMQNQLELVAKQRDESQLALAALQKKLGGQSQRFIKQQYMTANSDFGNGVSTIDEDDFVICFEENDLNCPGDMAQKSNLSMSRSISVNAPRVDRTFGVKANDTAMSSSMPAYGNWNIKRLSSVDEAETHAKQICDTVDASSPCVDSRQQTHLKEVHKIESSTYENGSTIGKVYDKNFNTLKQGTGFCSDGKKAQELTIESRKVKPSSSPKSGGGVVFKALLSSFRDTPQEVVGMLGQSLTTDLINLQPRTLSTELCKDRKEWIQGQDYVVDDTPVVFAKNQNGSCSFVFDIHHQGKPLTLKVIFTLLNSATSDDLVHASMYSRYSSEYDIMSQLSGHANILQIRHQYNSTVQSFEPMLKLLGAQVLDFQGKVSDPAFIIVTDRFPLTLQTFADNLKKQTSSSVQACTKDFFETVQGGSSVAPLNGQSVAPSGGGGLNSWPQEFVCLLLFQLLSAVDRLLMHGIVHRDIRPENVFLDTRLRPVLGGFGLARKLMTQDTQDIMFVSSDQIVGGNPHAWAPELVRLKHEGPKEVSLRDVYNQSDVFSVGHMFYFLLRPELSGENFPLVTPTKPHYHDSEIPQLSPEYSPGLRDTLKRLVADDPEERLTCAQAMTRIGVVLFGPMKGEVSCVKDCMIWRHARMMSLIRRAKAAPASMNSGLHSIEESIQVQSMDVERDLVLASNDEDIWEAYSWLTSL